MATSHVSGLAKGANSIGAIRFEYTTALGVKDQSTSMCKIANPAGIQSGEDAISKWTAGLDRPNAIIEGDAYDKLQVEEMGKCAYVGCRAY